MFVFSLLVKGLFICIGQLPFLLLFFFSEVQRKMRKEVTPLSCRVLITSHSRLTCVPGVCALLHFELLFIKFSKDAEGGTPVSLHHSLCVSASFLLFSVPCQPQGPPLGEIMGRNIGHYLARNCQGTKLEPGGATLGRSHPFRTFFCS